MRFNRFLEGLKTLYQYYDDPADYHIGTDHDQFYTHPTDNPLTPEDVQKMCALGWFQPQGGISEDGGEYDPEKGWIAFT